MFQKIKNYISFTKPGISRAQILTVSIGYFLAKQSIKIDWNYIYLIVATYCYSASACGANNLIEKNHDRKMNRTKGRELVTGEMNSLEAIIIIVLMFFIATIYMLKINMATLVISLITVVTYVAIYTPLKRHSWINTHVGAIPGALPLLGGWVATGTPFHMAVISLFFTLFCWQIPHFYALSMMYFDEYKEAGFRMLPNQHGGIQATKRQIIFFSTLMVLSSIYPFFIGFLSKIYLIGVLILSAIFWRFALQAVNDLKKNAKKLFILSIIYLPLWFTLIIIDIILN
ncbi:protoheme IX farnesyltransferase [Candidatus Marinamargulisbacteria bacterium SCGC AG-343-K17]|nr:protoheme IX farnesyltransferase [Candidatus Marinamargulisbacteria bacterium SCGC AG-343-K17]